MFVAIPAVEVAHTYYLLATITKLEFPSRLLPRSNIPPTMRLLSADGGRKGRRSRVGRRRRGRRRRTTLCRCVKDKKNVDDEKGEESAEGKEEGGRRDRTPTMRRRYATEYHYPDNGPAISSAACINLRVKGQDTRYLNK